MIEDMSPGGKDPVNLCRGNGGEGRGVEYATERHIFTFVEMKVLKLFLKILNSCKGMCLMETYRYMLPRSCVHKLVQKVRYVFSGLQLMKISILF